MPQPQKSSIPRRVPIAAIQQWHITGPSFKGPREDVIAALQGLQSIPAEAIAYIVATLNALPPEVRAVAVTARMVAHGRSGSLNLHWQQIF